MAYNLDIVQLWYILLTFSFALSPFESLRKILISFKIIPTFKILDLVITKFENVHIEDI